MAEITWLMGPNGEKSSKRLSGVLTIGIGSLIFVALAIVSFFTVVPGKEAIKYAGSFLIGTGAGLLGFGTVAERLGR